MSPSAWVPNTIPTSLPRSLRLAYKGPPMAALLGRLIAAQRSGQAVAGEPLGWGAKRAEAVGPRARELGLMP